MVINWKITDKEAAYIITVLTERPFKEVNALIGRLHLETSEQIKAAENQNGNSNSK